MLRSIFVIFVISAAITAGVSYLAEKNIAEKQFLLDKGITTTAIVTGYKITRGRTTSVEVYYSFSLPNGRIIDSYYMPPLEESPVNQNWEDDSILPSKAPKTVEILCINEPPYLSALKKEVFETVAKKVNRLNRTLAFFFGSFVVFSIVPLVITWRQRRRDKAARQQVQNAPSTAVTRSGKEQRPAT